MQQITPEQARAELERRRLAASSQITPEQARAELSRRQTASQPSQGGNVRQDATDFLRDPAGYLVTRGAGLIEQTFQNPLQSPSRTLSQTAPAAQMALQGASFGFGDEIAGGISGAGSLARGDGFSQGYTQETSEARDAISQSRQEYPVSSFLSEMAGGGVSFGGAGTSLAQRFPGAARQIAAFAARHPYISTALSGGGTGALYGAGEAEEGERLQGAVTGGALGAALGPAIRVALGLTGAAGARTLNALSGRSSRLARNANRAGLAADDVQRLGDGQFLAEVADNPRARSSLIGAAGAGGDAERAVVSAVDDRAAGRASRFGDAVERATGTRNASNELLQLDALREQARPMFNQADQEMVRVTPRIRELIREARRRGVGFDVADTLAREEGASPLLSSLTDDLDNMPEQLPLGSLRALARAAEARARGVTRATDESSALAPGLFNVGRELREAFGRQSPRYREAAGLWRGIERDDAAFEAGQALFRPGARSERDLRSLVSGGMSQSERRHFMAGVADAIDRRTGNTPETGNPASRIDRNILRRRISLALGDEAADELMQTVARETRQAQLENVARRTSNSATEPRQQGARDFARSVGGSGRQLAGDLVEDTTGALGVRRRVADAVRGQDPEAAAELARLLIATSRDDPTVQQFLRGLDRQFSAPQIGGIPQGAAAGMTAAELKARGS